MEEQIQQLQREIEEIRFMMNKNDFSNLYVFDTPVKFNKYIDFTDQANPATFLRFPVDLTAAGVYKGRIPITVNGVTQYLHYYDA